jgi:hypothetical protein
MNLTGGANGLLVGIDGKDSGGLIGRDAMGCGGE